ncbi:hypothetical protein JW865_06525 [Candidatus Bathyarchaeota archaeon]|nr:hypothetical protein [Candidatus Bathyarchaeota archaeon]
MVVDKNFWEINEFEEFKRSLAWMVDQKTSVVLGLFDAISPFISSYVKEEEDKVTLTDKGVSANYSNILYNLNFINVFGRDLLTNLGFVPDRVELSKEDYSKIKDKYSNLESWVYDYNKDTLSLYNVSEPFSNFRNDFAEIFKKQNLTDVKRLSNFEKITNNFVKNLMKVDWKKTKQTDYSRYTNSAREGGKAFASIELESSDDKIRIKYPYVIHKEFKTDAERFIAPFFTVGEEIQRRYFAVMELCKECQQNTGFLKSPSIELRNKTIVALNEFIVDGLTLHSSYYTLSKLYYGKIWLDNKKDNIKKWIDKRNESRKLISTLYDLVCQFNMVQPIMDKITPY